jgi:hypothetical protein
MAAIIDGRRVALEPRMVKTGLCYTLRKLKSANGDDGDEYSPRTRQGWGDIDWDLSSVETRGSSLSSRAVNGGLPAL